MKNLISISLIALILSTSCVSSKKYSSFVNEKLQADTVITQVNSKYDNWLIIKTDKIEEKDNQIKQLKYSFVPAILYWGWNSTIACEIDPSLTTTYIKNAIYNAADSLGLLEKANGKRLVINLKQVPGKFIYKNRVNTIILLIAYTVSAEESISPEQLSLVVDFEAGSNETIEVNGEISIQNNEQPRINQWKSSKKFTWFYLDEYKKETERMGTELVKELMQKL